jgi:hypothetical protein
VARKARVRVGEQLELADLARFPLRRPGRGGARTGARRKRAPGVRSSVPHCVRPLHDGRHPVLVTLRVRARAGLPSLRRQSVSAVLREVLRRQSRRFYAKVFHVIEHTIQDDHLHLIVEATGVVETGRADAPESLGLGMRGLVISLARQLNKLLGRRGKVWGDRWHGRELGSPSEVRNALVYVFRNLARHGARMFGDGIVDAFSSAPRFNGWSRPVMSSPFDDHTLWPPALPRTWMLEKGWRLLGLLDPNEARRRGR